jgi:hypothetical protein
MAYITVIFAISGLSLAIFPVQLRFLYLGWIKVTNVIGRAVTFLLMASAYYAIITPAAIIKRLAGGRPIPLHADKRKKSYWVDRAESAQPRERFFKRY